MTWKIFLDAWMGVGIFHQAPAIARVPGKAAVWHKNELEQPATNDNGWRV